MAAKEKPSYCAGMVRRLDRDRFLCTLFAPPERRDALFALYAFNLEVARIPELVQEPILGSVRLQWWRDTIAAIYEGQPPAHEVATGLARAVADFGLTRGYFDRLLEAREFDFAGAPPEDMESLIAYAGATSATLNFLALEVLDAGGGSDARVDAQDAGRDVGIAWALTGLIRAIPFHLRAGRVYLPASLLARENLRAADLRAFSPAMGRIVEDVAGSARGFLASARSHERGAPDWARPVLLPGVLASSYLSRIERADFDPFDLGIEGGGLRRQVRLWLAAAGGKI